VSIILESNRLLFRPRQLADVDIPRKLGFELIATERAASRSFYAFAPANPELLANGQFRDRSLSR